MLDKVTVELFSSLISFRAFKCTHVCWCLCLCLWWGVLCSYKKSRKYLILSSNKNIKYFKLEFPKGVCVCIEKEKDLFYLYMCVYINTHTYRNKIYIAKYIHIFSSIKKCVILCWWFWKDMQVPHAKYENFILCISGFCYSSK